MNRQPEGTAWTGGRTAGHCAARADGSSGKNVGFALMFGDLAPTVDEQGSTGGG